MRYIYKPENPKVTPEEVSMEIHKILSEITNNMGVWYKIENFDPIFSDSIHDFILEAQVRIRLWIDEDDEENGCVYLRAEDILEPLDEDDEEQDQ
jgi:hypothetical protein